MESVSNSEDERMKSPEPQTAGQSSLKFLRSQALQSPPFHFAISIYIKINGSGSMYPDGNTFTSHHCIHPLGSPCLLDTLLKSAEIICSIPSSYLSSCAKGARPRMLSN